MNQSRSDEEQPIQVLLRYAGVIARKWLLVLFTVVVAVLLSIAWTMRQPKVYQASCAVVIDPMAPQILSGVKDVVEMGTGSYWASKEFYETQYRVIRSREIIRRATERLGLLAPDGAPPAADGVAKTKTKTIERWLRAVSVAPIKDSRVANIVVTDTVPATAAAVANAVAAAYIEANLEHKLGGSQEANVWLGDQVNDLNRRTREAESALYEYRKKKQLLDIDLNDRRSMTSDNVRTFNAKLADLRSKRVELEAVQKLISASQGNPLEREALPAVVNSQIIQQLRLNYLELLRTRSELEAKYGDQHPRIVSLDRQIGTLKKDYQTEIDRLLRSHEKSLLELVEGEKALMRVLDKEKRDAIELSELELEFRPLARESENNVKMLEVLSQRQKETGLTGLIRTNNIRILEPAIAPNGPVSPKPLLNIGLAIVLGFALGTMIAFGLESMDNTVNGHEEVEQLTGVPVLGLVPLIGKGRTERKDMSLSDLRAKDLTIIENPKSQLAEACRSIRTNLLFLAPHKNLKSLLITSPGPQEGKTTTAINIAVIMAQSGARVLLVDADMRKPRLHRAFGIASEVGLSNLILGTVGLDEVIFKTEVDNLSLLPCGPIPPNPSELLHTERFKKLKTDLAQQYDWILFDSPPTSAVTDPVVVGNIVDGMLLVVRASSTRRDAVAAATRQLSASGGRLLGTIINRADFSKRLYRYDRYYQYYRSYGSYAQES